MYMMTPHSSVDTDQQLEAVCGHGDGGGREEGEEREERGPGPVAVAAALGQEHRLEVVAERDGDDGEVGAQREHREEREKDVKREEKPGVGRRWLGRKIFLQTLITWIV